MIHQQHHTIWISICLSFLEPSHIKPNPKELGASVKRPARLFFDCEVEIIMMMKLYDQKMEQRLCWSISMKLSICLYTALGGVNRKGIALHEPIHFEVSRY